jgi:hypothetical protein
MPRFGAGILQFCEAGLGRFEGSAKYFLVSDYVGLRGLRVMFCGNLVRLARGLHIRFANQAAIGPRHKEGLR